VRAVLVRARLEAVDLLLEVAVGNVVVAPVRHRIELQAVRELHLVCLAKLLELRPSLARPLGVPSLSAGSSCVVRELLELECLCRGTVTVWRDAGHRGCRGGVAGGGAGTVKAVGARKRAWSGDHIGLKMEARL